MCSGYARARRRRVRWYNRPVRRSPSALDAPVSLSDLLEPADLEEVARCFVELHGVPIAIRSDDGAVEVAAGDRGALGTGAHHSRPLVYDGRDLGEVIVGPYDPSRIGDDAVAAVARAVTRMLGVLVHAAYARHLTAAAHVAAMDDAYRELAVNNERLAEAVARLQEVDRLKSNFLATVSHELRTPLTSVIGYSEMLVEGLAGELNDEQQDYVRTILAKADQLLQLITGILDLTAMEAGALRIARAPVAVDELIDRVVATFEPHARTKGIAIGRSRPVGVRVFGDERKVHQILTHLVTNAVKFTRSGGRVDVSAEVGPLERDAVRADGSADRDALGVRITVSDSGIGIPPEKQAHIFEPFFQVDSSSTREYGGTGLGLTLVKSYVEVHGGAVWVDSEPGRGSRFVVTLPAVPDDLDSYLATAAHAP